MTKIVVSQPLGFYPDQIEKLKKLGDTTFYDNMAVSPEEWLERIKGADVICTGRFGLKQKIYELNNTFLALPFVGVGWMDKAKIKAQNVTVSYAPGCNKDAVSEWIIFMLLSLLRKFILFVNNNSLPKGVRPGITFGLTNKNITILGKGNIGSRVGKICESLDAKVSFFQKADNLFESVKAADVIIDCLGYNATTKGLLGRDFFQSVKKGAYFITVTSKEIWDVDAIIKALDDGILEGIAADAASVQFGDIYDPFYQKLLKHPKILVTPHIAHNSDVTDRVSNDMIINNIEAWLKGKPINIL